MPNFDANAAKAAGYSDDEIRQFMGQQGLPVPDYSGMSHLNSVSAGEIAPKYDPTAGEGRLQFGPFHTGIHTSEGVNRILAGTGRGLVHTVNSLRDLVGDTGKPKQNLSGIITGQQPESRLEEEAHIDAPLLNTTSGKFGNMIGETAITAPLGAGVASGVASFGKLGADIAGNAFSNAALQGGVQGTATSDNGDRGVNSLVGALTGGTLSVGGSAASKLARGLTRTPEAQRLLDEGISLTPGQLNPKGFMNQFEQAAESLPGAKQVIEPSRDSAEHAYQAVIIGKGAAPGSAPIKPSGNIHDMLQQAYDTYAPLYTQAHGYPVTPSIVRTAGGDIPLANAFEHSARAAGVPKSLQKSENEWLQDRLTQLPKNPKSEDLLQLRSDIRQRARTANLKNDTNSGHVANINSRAEQTVTQALESQLPPAPLKALSSADSNYGNYKVIENAVAKSKDNLAGLTPQKLSQAISDAVPDAAYARGAGGPLRDLAKAGTEVFQNVSPPTGARLATLASAGLGVAHPYVGLPVGASLLSLIGTKAGRDLSAGITRPQLAAQKLADALRAKTPDYARNIGSAYANRLGVAAGAPVVQQALPQILSAALLGFTPSTNAVK